MGNELPIRLIRSDGKSVDPSSINADPDAFITDDLIKIGDKAVDYIVERKQLLVDSGGRFAILIAGGFVFLAANDETKLAYAGYATARAPWVLFIGAIAALTVISNKLEKRIGYALSVAVGMSGANLGAALAFLWDHLFLPQMPNLWPADYVRLARQFWQHSSSLVAVGAAYAPVILFILKFLHLEFIGTIASVFTKRKRAE
jgi:hypothetical protein